MMPGQNNKKKSFQRCLVSEMLKRAKRNISVKNLDRF
jgi:hypothetical protein